MEKEVIIGIVSTLFGLIIGYVTSFLKEKGKNKALIQDVKKITREKEEVLSAYQLDISKRKYQYEAKREQYINYFNVLDKLGMGVYTNIRNNARGAAYDLEFNLRFALGSKKKEKKVWDKYKESIEVITAETKNNLLTLKNDTNTIRLISGEKVSKRLDELEVAYEELMELAREMIKSIIVDVVHKKGELPEHNSQEITNLEDNIRKLKKQLIQDMKSELNEI